MVDFSNLLGAVTVEVRADLENLLASFSEAKVQATAFKDEMAAIATVPISGVVTEPTAPVREGGGGAGGPANNQMVLAAQEAAALEEQYRALEQAYNPVGAAASGFADKLEAINTLTEKGKLSTQEAADWTKKAGKEYEETTFRLSGMGKGLDKLREGFKHAAESARELVGILGVVGIVSLGEMVSKTLEANAALARQAKILQLDGEQYQALILLGKRAGISQEELTGGLRIFEKAVNQASAGSKRYTLLFKDMGVSIKGADGQTKAYTKVLFEFATQLANIRDHGQRGAAAIMAFGNANGTRFQQLLAGGAAGIAEFTKEMTKAGEIIGNPELAKAEETAVKMDHLKTVLAADFSHTVIANADSIISLADALAKLTDKILKFINSDPQTALTLIGAVGGGLMGGIPGAVVGAGGGFAIGGKMQQKNDADTNVQNRLGHLRAEVQVYKESKVDTTEFGKMWTGIHATEVLRQQQMYDAAVKAAKNAPKVVAKKETFTGPDHDLSNLLHHGGKEKAAKEPKQNEFDKEELTEQKSRLEFEKQLTADVWEQNKIDKEIIDIKTKERGVALDKMVHDKTLTAAQAKRLKAEEAINAGLEKELADRRMGEAIINRNFEMATKTNQIQAEGLNLDLSMARTVEAKHRIEKRILALKESQQLAEIDKDIAIASSQHDEERIAELTKDRLFILENQKTEQKSLAVQQLEGIAKFRDDLAKEVEDINHAIAQINFDKFSEKLQQMATFAQDVGDAFGQAAGEIVNFKKPLDVLRNLLGNLAKQFTQNFVERPVADFAKKRLGDGLAQRLFKPQLDKENRKFGPDALTIQQMNEAMKRAVGDFDGLKTASHGTTGDVTHMGEASHSTAGNITDMGQAAHQAAAALRSVKASPSGTGRSQAEIDAIKPTEADMNAVDGAPGTPSLFGGGGDLAPVSASDAGLNAAMAAMSGDLSNLSSTVASTALSFTNLDPKLGQFGNSLISLLSSLAGGGGGGGGAGGLLKLGLSLLGSAIGGGIGGGGLGASGGGAFVGVTDPGMLSGAFAEGGWIGGEGGPKEDKVHIKASPGEFMVHAAAAKKFAPVLESINSGLLPDIRSLGAIFPSNDTGNSMQVDVGGIHIHGVSDERSARRSGRQAGAEVNRAIAEANRAGVRR